MDTKALEKKNEEEIAKRVKDFKPSPSFATALVPKSFKEAYQMAEVLCKSNVIPKDFQGRPQSALIAIGMGMELGLPPLQAIQNIMVVNGRPTIWGDAVKALIIGNKVCEAFEEDGPAKALKQGFGRCVVKRKGHKAVEITFSIEDAKKAGLWNKPGPWQNYPGRMLMHRARSWAARDAFPDILKGFGVREEVEDYTETTQFAPTPMPQEAPIAEPEKVVDAEVVPEGENQPAQHTPAELISENDRKALFKKAREAGVSMEQFKTYLFDKFAIKSSADIPYRLLPEIEKWMQP